MRQVSLQEREGRSGKTVWVSEHSHSPAVGKSGPTAGAQMVEVRVRPDI